MLTFRRPSEVQIRAYLAQRAGEPFSYDAVGCTREEPQWRPGWNVDRQRVLLGRGSDVFERACEAIQRWQMFPPAITRLCWTDQPPREGLAVGILYRAAPLRLWVLMAAKVIYVVSGVPENDRRRIERFGFAYGTLPDHAERGEERFLVEWDHRDDSVWYDLLAVSQPAHWLARIGYPYTRLEQARFRRLSGEAMAAKVSRTISAASDGGPALALRAGPTLL
jgi:uncharacterized protein (UPF0548 family)